MTREDEARELLAVTQADREAALDYERQQDIRAKEPSFLIAVSDESPLVQAFAKHRLASTQAGEDSWEATLRYCERQWGQERATMLDKITELRASLPTARADIGEDAVEGVAMDWRAGLAKAFNDDLTLPTLAVGVNDGVFPLTDHGPSSWSDWLIERIEHYARQSALASLQSSRVAVGPSDAGGEQ